MPHKVGFALDQPIYHSGPIQIYMSKAPSGTSAAAYDGSGAWFKISYLGPTFSPGAINWPATNVGLYNFKIPARTRSFPSLFPYLFPHGLFLFSSLSILLSLPTPFFFLLSYLKLSPSTELIRTIDGGQRRDSTSSAQSM